ncbi:MAG TPA: methionyl-tRNA formyltransferase [Candidatus Cybelea sp.]|nr:methionyl-tRNA formyltransferase [Candidatus Cybelea sp.]
MNKLRLVFMGTPEFALPTLTALLSAGHDVTCVYSQPPRPSGRGHHETRSPVHDFAVSRGLSVRTPVRLKGIEEQAAFAALRSDACVVVAYGLILPKAILSAPRLGCVNLHASILPRWRGAAPIQRAILAGDRETGVSIMQMDEGLDTGPVLAEARVPIAPESTAGTLHDELARVGAPLMVQTLAALAAGTAKPQPQPATGVTYAAKIERDEGRMDWRKGAIELDRIVRAMSPWPGAWFEVSGARVKIQAAQPVDGLGEPGTVLDDELTIACGLGALKLTRLQRPGRAQLDAKAWLRGNPIPKGTVLT